LYDTRARKVVIRCDVVSFEDQKSEDILNTKEHVPESILVGVPPKDNNKTEIILTHVLQIQLNNKLMMMIQKMCKMMNIVVKVMNMPPINKSMIMLKKMIMIRRKHQVVHSRSTLTVQCRGHVLSIRHTSYQYGVLLCDIT
jgi:hypothetical protein